MTTEKAHEQAGDDSITALPVSLSTYSLCVLSSFLDPFSLRAGSCPPLRYLSRPFANLGQYSELGFLFLSVSLTLPILRPALHNIDDSVGTNCIRSPQIHLAQDALNFSQLNK